MPVSTSGSAPTLRSRIHTHVSISCTRVRARARTDPLPPRSRDANKAFSKLVPNCNIAWPRERSFLNTRCCNSILSTLVSLSFSVALWPRCTSPACLQDSLSFSISFSLCVAYARGNTSYATRRKGKNRSVRNGPRAIDRRMRFSLEKNKRILPKKRSTFEKTDKSRGNNMCLSSIIHLFVTI